MCPRIILCFEGFFSYFTGFRGVIATMRVAQSAFYGGSLEVQMSCPICVQKPCTFSPTLTGFTLRHILLYHANGALLGVSILSINRCGRRAPVARTPPLGSAVLTAQPEPVLNGGAGWRRAQFCVSAREMGVNFGNWGGHRRAQSATLRFTAGNGHKSQSCALRHPAFITQGARTP
jgi:hypothetical protein